jgi:hypothetical protein
MGRVERFGTAIFVTHAVAVENRVDIVIVLDPVGVGANAAVEGVGGRAPWQRIGRTVSRMHLVCDLHRGVLLCGFAMRLLESP